MIRLYLYQVFGWAFTLKADKGITIMYAASENESALDTDKGAAYLFSLLAYARSWETIDNKYEYLPLNTLHSRATKLMYQLFTTIQRPTMNTEKRRNHFPFAVMYPLNFR